MMKRGQDSILMLSIHGYVAAKPELSKPDTGGQVVFVLEMGKRFARLGYKVDLVTRGFEDQPEEEEVYPGFRIRRIFFGGEDFVRKEDMHDHLDEFVENFFEQLGDKPGYDLVYSHYWDAGWAGMKLAERLGVPHVHTPHSVGIWKKEQMLDAEHPAEEIERVYRFTERIAAEEKIYHGCNALICTTEQQKRLVCQEYGLEEHQVPVIPAGIDDERYTPSFAASIDAIREDVGFAATDIYTVGRAAENKGIDLLIRSFPYVRELVPEARLQLAVGAGSEHDQRLMDRWQELARELKVDDATHWIGYVPDGKMADYYRAPGVFALPSRYEPFGMTAIEAMACGTPTVITIHGGLCSKVSFGEHALYGDPHQPQEYGTLLALPMRYARLRDQMAVNGAELARQKFGWTGIAKQTLKVFHEVSR